MTVLEVPTHGRCELIDVTGSVGDLVSASGIQDGLVICYVPHTTAGVTIQENADPDVVSDLLYKLEQMVPRRDASYQHAEGNSDAHIKASLIGASQTVPVRGGRMMLGTWQGIYFAEFDGPRRRHLYVLCAKT